MCKEMPVIPVNKVVDPKRIIRKKWRAEEEGRHKGSLTQKNTKNNPLGVNNVYFLDEWRGKQKISPPGITSPPAPGDKIHPWGTTVPLGSKYAPRGEVKNGPLTFSQAASMKFLVLASFVAVVHSQCHSLAPCKDNEKLCPIPGPPDANGCPPAPLCIPATSTFCFVKESKKFL
jgi:hypothetical protein